MKYVEYKQCETNRPSIVWVQFHDASVGKETRTKYRNRQFYHNAINETWTPVFDIERSFIYNRKTFHRIQFPLQPSAGRSVHRAQGTTLEKVVIDLSQKKPRKVPHLHYVALSRVKSLKGLQILNWNELALSVDSQVDQEMDRLNKDSQLHLCYEPLESVCSVSHFKLAFNNCRSLHLHFDDVKHDKGVLSAHVFALAETRLCETDCNSDYAIEGFRLIRNDQNRGNMQTRPAHGLAVYIKEGSSVNSELCYTSKQLEFIKFDVDSILSQMQIVVLYKAPSMNESTFTSTLEKELIPHLNTSKKIVVMGDFNFQIADRHKKAVEKLSKMFNCEMYLNEPTTDQFSTLDLIFANVHGTAGTVEAYWSDHKIVTFYT